MIQHNPIFAFCSLIVGGLIAVKASNGQESCSQSKYVACVSLARSEPEQGFEKASAWLALGGWGAAQHCAAVSLIGLKHNTEAAIKQDAMNPTFLIDRA